MTDTTTTTTTTTTTPKRRTITLTDRPPVTIREDEWPVIAEAKGDSYGGLDAALHRQARLQDELDCWLLRVRQHADGRALVYGRYMTGQCSDAEPWRGGELLPAGADLAAAIRRVGASGPIPALCIRECIADLPAEEI